MERETIGRIVDLTKLTYYNIRNVNTVTDGDALSVSVDLIQPINDLFYFETLQNTIPLQKLKKQFNKKTLAECALLTKTNDWLGFQYCADQACYPIADSSLFDSMTDDENQKCLTKKVLDSTRTQDYVRIANATRLIEQRILDGSLQLDNGFRFQSLENEYELNQIDKESYFNLIRDERCFNQTRLGAEMSCKLKPRLTDCILTCQSTNCNMFSMQQLDDRLECCFVEQTYTAFEERLASKHETLDDYLINNQTCSLYELSYLSRFTRLGDRTVDGEPLNSLIARSPDECARHCVNYNQKNASSQCLSFNYCFEPSGDYHCVLRSYSEHRSKEQLHDSHECALYTGKFRFHLFYLF